MNANWQEDATLVDRFKSGDREAFNEIDRRYRARLVCFLFQRVRSQDLAEELAQETLTRALAALSSLNDGCYLAQWLYRIARNNLIDYSRKSKPSDLRIVSYNNGISDSVGVGDSVSEFIFTGNERRPNGVRFNNFSPDEEVVCSEEHINIWRVAKERLSVEEFQALWMKYVDGFSDERIASELNKRVVTTRVFLSRIRKKLAKHMRNLEEFSSRRLKR